MRLTYPLAMLLLITLFVGVSTLRLSHHRKVLALNDAPTQTGPQTLYHRVAKMFHNEFEQNHDNFGQGGSSDENSASGKFLAWLESKDGVKNNFGSDQPLPTEDAEKIRGYLLEHPDAFVEITSESSLADCFEDMNKNQQNAFAKIVIQQTDFTKLTTGEASLFTTEKIQAIQDATESDDLIAQFVDKCIPLIEQAEDQDDSSSGNSQSDE